MLENLEGKISEIHKALGCTISGPVFPVKALQIYFCLESVDIIDFWLNIL
jgi:hypothetical protein